MDPPREQYTVESKPKVELLDDKSKDNASICLCLFKWVITFLLFCTILFCIVASKLSIISLAHRLKPADISPTRYPSIPGTVTTPTKRGSSTKNPATGFSNRLTTSQAQPTNKTSMYPSQDGSMGYDADVAYTMIILFMMIPHCISFVRAFCKSAFSSIELWPGRMSLFMGIVAAVLETAGLCLFSLVVMSSMRNFMHSIFLMNGIFICPLLLLMANEFRKVRCRQQQPTINKKPEEMELHENGDDQNAPLQPETNDPGRRPLLTLHLFTISATFSLAGLSLILYSVDSIIERIVIPISIILLSIAWCPQLLKYQTLPGLAALEEHLQRDTRGNEENCQIKIRSARQRMTLISSLIKLVLTIVFSICLNFLNLTNTKNEQFPLINGFNHFFDNNQMIIMFLLQVFCSILGYLVSWLVCKINLQKTCFVFPFLLSTPVAIILTAPLVGICEDILRINVCFDDGNIPGWQTALLGLLLWISGFSFNFQFFKSQQFLMAKEEVIFWLPTYDGILLEQQLLLNRKNEYTDERYINYRQIVKDSRIYICTTMYHEADFEMEQLLHSIADLDEARKQSGRNMEAHVFFDDGARENVILMYALQLLSLLKDTVHVDPTDVRILETPYGLQLNYILRHGMKFVVHLKDNIKVKNKKRWSQVMYMSYILDYKGKEDKVADELSYILATDADVKFSHTDVMALMDFMSRDPNIAAVCGRTHPMGTGPIVWYQVFDYAIGHWLQKVANHVMGTVLCSPGCFSVYRARAVRDVLPLYATGVNSPIDFLMKDMGEDRWFCTLLIEAGWKLEYCASAADSTYCPDEFEEFFKQRRRWGPSTFANQVEVLRKQRNIRHNNDSISILFMLYQLVLLVSSTIGPSTILLFMAAGLQFAYPNWFNMIVVLIFLIIVTVGFAFACMYCSGSFQIKMAKILAFFFAIIMAVTAVGCMVQVVDDINKSMYPPTMTPLTTNTPLATNNPIIAPTVVSTDGPIYKTNAYIFQVTTWYSLVFIGVFVVTGILHGSEVLSLICGVLYWLCLPTGHLLLTIYSIANLTDRSWGTREGKQRSYDDPTSWKEFLSNYFRHICKCCIPPENRNEPEYEEEIEVASTVDPTNIESIYESSEMDNMDGADENEERVYALPENAVRIQGTSGPSITNRPGSHLYSYANMEYGKRSSIIPAVPYQHALRRPAPPPRKRAEHLLNRRSRPIYGRFMSKGGTIARHATTRNDAITVEEWLPKQYKEYSSKFREHGYDNVSFISGAAKEKDLIEMGIENRGHRKKLMVLIDCLPPNEFLNEVPEDVEEWLINLGLHEYWPRFVANSYTEQRDLADLKHMTGEQIATLFNIKKEGHLRKLLIAAKNLQYATKGQKLIRQTRQVMLNQQVKKMMVEERKEYKFWEKLREICLLPEQAAFNKSAELGEKLAEMRGRSFLMLLVINTLWLTFMGTVMYQGPKLHLMGSSFSGVAFTVIYAFILIVQLIALLIHRVTTFIHFIARAPFTPGNFKGNWAWKDDNIHDAPDQRELRECRKGYQKSIHRINEGGRV